MTNNKQYFLIILTAIFSTLSLILDQGVYQVEKLIITKEQKLNTYEDLIQTTKQMHVYYDNAKNNLSNKMEVQIIDFEQNQTLLYLYPYDNIHKIKNDKLTEIYEDFKIYTLNTEFDYLIEQNIEEINKVRKTFIEKFNEKNDDIILKLEGLREYLYKLANIHMSDLIDSETMWIYDGNEINKHRFLRQILIVVAFMLNISALLCLLYYFKSILGRKVQN